MPNGVRSRHVWGHDVTHDEGRASSAIADFDVPSMTVVTRSGTRYRLAGLPGNARAGKLVWKKWCRMYRIVSERDVTNEYLNVDALSAGDFEIINDSIRSS